MNIELIIVKFLAVILELIIAISIFVWLMMKWVNEGYLLLEDEVIVKSGIVSQQEKSYPYNNMQSVIVKQGFLGRWLNYGDVRVFIPTLGEELVFQEVPNPGIFAEKLKKSLKYPDKGQYIIRK